MFTLDTAQRKTDEQDRSGVVSIAQFKQREELSGLDTLSVVR